MYLVPEDVIETWKTEQRSLQVDKPVENTIKGMDSKLQAILKDNTLSDYDKEKLYNQNLGTYVNMRDQSTKKDIMSPSPQTPQSSTDQASDALGHKNNDDILTSVPKMYRRKADAFLKYIQSDKDIAWDQQGQLILKGQVIPKSHIIDLIHDSLRLRKKVKRANGWRELSHHLSNRNVPKELIGNETWSTSPNTPAKKDKPFVKFATTPGKPRKSKVLGRQKIQRWITLQDEF